MIGTGRLLAAAALAALETNGAVAASPHPASARDEATRALLAQVEATRALLAQVETTRGLLLVQVETLSREVEALRAKVDAQATSRPATVATAAETAGAAAVDPAAAAWARTAVAPTVATTAAPATLGQSQDRLGATARPADRPTGLAWKGITITPAGFVELAGLWRQHYQGNDVASNLLVPFPNNLASHEHEARLSARQSRFSILAQGRANAATQLAMFVELDFLGAAQTANSNQSNSYNPRLRHLYATIDWARGDDGIHLLAGQAWSLVTPNIRGIVPRTEFVPPQIESQNLPGYFWARQPQVRVAADFLDHRLWLAASIENPQTTFAGVVPPGITFNQTAGQGFDNANTLSINQVPDVAAKVAYDANLAGHAVHLEAFGIARTFAEHVNGGGSRSTTTLGYGGAVIAQAIPARLDLELAAMSGRGIGRYGSVGLPDVTFGPDGLLHPVPEVMLLAGGTVHVDRSLDVYALGGVEQEGAEAFAPVDAVAYGVGNPLANNAGCLVEGGICAGNSRRVRQVTIGLWDRFYQGSFGRVQVGLQYSLTQRALFNGVGGAPQASNNTGLVSLRYYPF